MHHFFLRTALFLIVSFEDRLGGLVGLRVFPVEPALERTLMEILLIPFIDIDLYFFDQLLPEFLEIVHRFRLFFFLCLDVISIVFAVLQHLLGVIFCEGNAMSRFHFLLFIVGADVPLGA